MYDRRTAVAAAGRSPPKDRSSGPTGTMTMPETLISPAEFELIPDTPGKQELLEGELIELPPSKSPHLRIVRAIYKLLLASAAEPRVFTEASYQMLPDGWLQPDVSVNWPDQHEANDYFQRAPMLAIEVISPGNKARDIDRKTTLYLKHGAAEVWIVYPDTRSILVHKKSAVEKVTGIYQCDLIPVLVAVSEIVGGKL